VLIRITHKERIMEASQASPSRIAIPPTHPLLLITAASVTLLSLTGAGVLAGWLPGPGTHSAPIRITAAPAAAPVSARQNVTVPQEKARTVAKSGESVPASLHRDAPAPVADPAIAVVPAPTFSTASHEAARPVAAPTPAVCTECGVVEAVREIAVEPKGSGGGAIAGGLVGGLIASRIGKGATRSIATVLGAAGGAYAGNYIEKSMRESKRYEVLVRFEDDSRRTFGSETPPAWQSGDRVRLQNGLLTMGGGKSKGNPELI